MFNKHAHTEGMSHLVAWDASAGGGAEPPSVGGGDGPPSAGGGAKPPSAGGGASPAPARGGAGAPSGGGGAPTPAWLTSPAGDQSGRGGTCRGPTAPAADASRRVAPPSSGTPRGTEVAAAVPRDCTASGDGMPWLLAALPVASPRPLLSFTPLPIHLSPPPFHPVSSPSRQPSPPLSSPPLPSRPTRVSPWLPESAALRTMRE